MKGLRWTPYPTSPHITGDLRTCKLHSPQLDNERDITVWLPPSYKASDKRYRVIYMQDGNNLFDEATSFAGEWRVDESMSALAKEGIEAIIVGISNIDGEPFGIRQEEYSPFVGEGGRGGKGDAYLDFLVDTLKLLVDSSFRTLADREHTGIAGSSLGAYISLYAVYARAKVFGFAAAFSPYFGFSRDIYSYISSAEPEPSPKLYLDVGGKETGDAEGDEGYVSAVAKMTALLKDKDATLKFSIDPNGQHNEASWSRRFPNAMRWLLHD